MYRPPENMNRVKTMRSMFENSDSLQKPNQVESKALTKSKTELHIVRSNLSRQLSDPSKKIIKRTPAFRLPEKNFIAVQDELSDSDMNSRRNNVKYKTTHVKLRCGDKEKIQFADLVCKFNGSNSLTSPNGDRENSLKSLNGDGEKNLSFLYSKPVPKALRAVKCDSLDLQKSFSDDENLCRSSTLKLCDKIDNEKSSEDISRESNNDFDGIFMTDTLKNALKKPLPTGPPPKKPPRTFLESPESPQINSKTRKEFSTLLRETLKSKPESKNQRPKGDPKYMLDKLEKALKSNKIRPRKQRLIDSVTSGEDSDDNATRKTPNKNMKTLPRNYSSGSTSCFHLKCLNALGCKTSLYEQTNQSRSSFFLERKDEPVYAEPFQFEKEKIEAGNKQKNEITGNSLHYMSIPIIGDSSSDMKRTVLSDPQPEKQMATCDTSSLSSAYGSDIESAASTPVDEPSPIAPPSTNRIRDIISAFEVRKEPDGCAAPTPNSEQRIRDLESQLRKTLDRSFASRGVVTGIDSSSSEDGKKICNPCGDGQDEMTNKFETYVRRVRVYSEGKGRKDEDRLFQCCLIVGLNKRTPYIKMKYPENVEIPSKIEQLCFPDGIDGPMDRSGRAQCYSLVITNEKGKRTFGYCRRVIPEGSENCIPLAYCILSKHRAPRFYKRVLQELESRHGLPDKQREMLLNEFYYRSFPKPGESLVIDLTKLHDAYLDNDLNVSNGGAHLDVYNNNEEIIQSGGHDGKPDLKSYVVVNTGEYGMLKRFDGMGLAEMKREKVKSATVAVSPKDRLLRKANSSPSLDLEIHPNELILALHQDSRYEEAGLKDLHAALSTNIIQKVFSSLLLERKVILVSCVLSKLSSCIEALQSILYPFSWPHTLIPILPQSLWEIVEAPTPFLCGVLSVAVVNMYKIENAFIVDLDEGGVLLEVGDEEKILPSALVKTWKNGLSHAKLAPVNDTAHAVFLSDAYLRVFIHSCGHYRQFLVDGVFDKEAFMQHVKSKGIRRFLTWFTETTMFHTFLDGVRNDPSYFAIFDKRIQIYGSEESSVILEKMKDWKKEKTRSVFFRV